MRANVIALSLIEVDNGVNFSPSLKETFRTDFLLKEGKNVGISQKLRGGGNGKRSCRDKQNYGAVYLSRGKGAYVASSRKLVLQTQNEIPCAGNFATRAVLDGH